MVHPKKDWGCWGSGKAFFLSEVDKDILGGDE